MAADPLDPYRSSPQLNVRAQLGAFTEVAPFGVYAYCRRIEREMDQQHGANWRDEPRLMEMAYWLAALGLRRSGVAAALRQDGRLMILTFANWRVTYEGGMRLRVIDDLTSRALGRTGRKLSVTDDGLKRWVKAAGFDISTTPVLCTHAPPQRPVRFARLAMLGS